ncbi:MAG: hypothetical protein ACKV2T_21095 [Kofleriaceae bacterium]
MKTLLSLCIVLLAACPLQKSVNYSGPGGGGSSSSPSSPSSSSSSSSSSGASTTAEDPNAERERMAQYHAEQGQKNLDNSTFLRREFEALKGLKVADAKAKAKAFGHAGDVRVEEEGDFVKGCEPGIVCRASDELGGESGMGNGDVLLLWTNKSLTISGPPE